MRKKQEIILNDITIESVAAEGKALAHVDGTVVFVQFAVPGDIVDIKITKKKKNYMEGYILALKKPSEHRLEPFCKYFGICGGCKWQPLPYPMQLQAKQQQVYDQLVRIGHLQVPDIQPIIGSEKITNYRNKLEFTFSERRWIYENEDLDALSPEQRLGLGFHVGRFFDKVLDIDCCHLQPSPSNEIRNFIRQYAIDNGLSFFNIREHHGFLRTMVVRNNEKGEVMLILCFYHEDENARRKLLDKLTVEEMPASSRRYPWVAFSPDREVGKDILFVTDVSKTIDGVKVLDKVSFIVGHGDKIAFVGDNENAHTALFKILAGEMEPDEGTVKWGQTATFSYFPKDNTPYFQDNDDNLVQWLRQFSPDPQEQYLRGFLGRMLFSGDEVYKAVKVLSGGEKVRCMLSRMMLSGANVLMLDQPTNHLDLESIAALNKGLEMVKCNVLVASHDHQLIQTVCNRIFDFTADGKLVDRMMTYDEYLESQKPQ